MAYKWRHPAHSSDGASKCDAAVVAAGELPLGHGDAVARGVVACGDRRWWCRACNASGRLDGTLDGSARPSRCPSLRSQRAIGDGGRRAVAG